MADRQPPKSAPKPEPKHRRKLKDVDLDYPNDKTFHLVSIWAACFYFFSVRVSHSTTCCSLWMPHRCPPSPQNTLSPGIHSLKALRYGLLYGVAMQYSGATGSEQALRRHVKRFFKRQEFDNSVESGGGEIVSSPNYIVPSPSSSTPGDNEPFTDLSKTPPGDATTSPNLSTTPPRDPTSKDSSITKERNQAIDKLSDWISKGKTSDAMTKRKQRTTLEMNRENFNDQAIKCYYDTQY